MSVPTALMVTERLVMLTTGILEMTQEAAKVSALLRTVQAENRDPTPAEWAALDSDLDAASKAAHDNLPLS